MALSLGNPNLSGNPEHVRAAGRTILLCLSPYFALGIADGFFLLTIIDKPLYFAAYDFTKFVVIPGIYLIALKRMFGVSPSDYFFTGTKINYKGWEWIAITFFSAFLLDIVYYSANGFFSLGAALLTATLRALLSPWIDLPFVLPGYHQYFSYAMALPDDRVLRAFTAIFYSITAGIVEEIFFRGLLRQAISALFGSHAVRTYIFASASIWSGPLGTRLSRINCRHWVRLCSGDSLSQTRRPAPADPRPRADRSLHFLVRQKQKGAAAPFVRMQYAFTSTASAVRRSDTSR